MNPATVIGGNTSTGTVTLSGKAHTGGVKVTLTCGSSNVIIPVSVTIPSGSTSATFSAGTREVSSDVTTSIRATLGSMSTSATFTVSAPQVASVTFTPTSVTGGTNSTGRVTLTGKAPVGGVVVNLISASDHAHLKVTSVTVAFKSATATFTVTTVPVKAKTTAYIYAAIGTQSAKGPLTINP
jgi:hypothetical protein